MSAEQKLAKVRSLLDTLERDLGEVKKILRGDKT